MWDGVIGEGVELWGRGGAWDRGRAVCKGVGLGVGCWISREEWGLEGQHHRWGTWLWVWSWGQSDGA